MDEGTSNQIDPSCISLFNCPSPSDLVTNDFCGTSNSVSEAFDYKPDGQKISYTKYADNKGKEVAKRKVFVERMERMKEARGIFFNIPQFNLATMNQVCLSMKKFSRSSDVKSFISSNVLEHVFSDISTKQQKLPETVGELLNGEEADILASKRKSPITRQIVVTSDEDNTDIEEDEFVDRKLNMSVELYDLLEQRSHILTADAHAKRLLRELEQKQFWVESQLSNIKDDLMFESPVDTCDDEVDSLTCARCRPLISRSEGNDVVGRQLLSHIFNRRSNDTFFRPLISNKKCGVYEYSFTDESVHRLLSLPSAISMDVQLQKYLHVISFISPEVELRRFRTARIINQSNGKEVVQKFYDLIEDAHDEQTSLDGDSHYEQGTRGIRLSFHKKGHKHKRKRHASNYSEDDADTDDPGDGDFVPSPTFLSNKKRRCMTFDNQEMKKLYSSKPSKMENRRSSHVEFGASMFDYDAQLMDIGLPLPTIQNVENVEIAVPSFRRRPAILDNHSETNSCKHCQNMEGGQECIIWTDIRRLHGELESQERQNRCARPSNCGTITRKLTASCFE
uniref:Uncharacterized protein n=1 Tax=Meloidogyne enterolobii TaxID=390850 RepID=A0A6V7U959_MELEN|nr:unnamed protein product [Meloidogyne enterolobii]